MFKSELGSMVPIPAKLSNVPTRELQIHDFRDTCPLSKSPSRLCTLHLGS